MGLLADAVLYLWGVRELSMRRDFDERPSRIGNTPMRTTGVVGRWEVRDAPESAT